MTKVPPTSLRISGGAPRSQKNHPPSPVRWIRLLGSVASAPKYKRSSRSSCDINLARLHRFVRRHFQISSASPPLTSPFQDHFGMCKPSGTSSAESG
jgi:hypothetical protein